MKHTKMLLLLLLLPTYYINATITWNGAYVGHATQDDSSIVNVTDEDLVIHGDVQLPLAGVTITAATTDVNVTFIGGPNPADTTTRANDLATLLDQTNLNLIVAAGHKIIFHINPSNVRFRGTNLETAFALMINAEGIGGGSGDIQFVCEQPNKTIQFTSRADSGGCKFNIIASEANGAPRVLFITPHSTNQVIIGGNGSELGMKVSVAGLVSGPVYPGFVFDAAGATQSNAALVMKSFSSIALQIIP